MYLLIYLQACKGKYYAASHGLDDLEEADESKQQNLNKIKTDDDINLMSENTFKVPLAPDMLIVYATVEGKAQFPGQGDIQDELVSCSLGESQ